MCRSSGDRTPLRSFGGNVLPRSRPMSWSARELNPARSRCKRNLRPGGRPLVVSISRTPLAPRAVVAAFVSAAGLEPAISWFQARRDAASLRADTSLGDRPVSIRHRCVHSAPCRATTPRPPCFGSQGWTRTITGRLQRPPSCFRPPGILVPGRGIEPRLTASETALLPLEDPGSKGAARRVASGVAVSCRTTRLASPDALVGAVARSVAADW